MNILEFIPDTIMSDIAFCIVDRTEYAVNNYAKEIVKNQADYTISNIVGKGYAVYQGLDEDNLLRKVSLNFKHAVVITTGTEFINGFEFFQQIENIKNTNIALSGHILDRGDAYYELHHQCYYINLEIYKQQGMPNIGQQELGSSHLEILPIRSSNNFHDNYTPTWVKPGTEIKEYFHKCHGWNIISTYFNSQLEITIFSQETKDYKIHLYPEYINDFNQNMGWINFRQNYCSSNFVHTDNTEFDYELPEEEIYQLVTPASGLQLQNLISHNKPMRVVFYDYNNTALDYWREHAPKIDNVEYHFVYADLLGNKVNIKDLLDTALAKNTLINISNIFCYEGTACFANLNYRIFKENELISSIVELVPDAYVRIMMRSCVGFEETNNIKPFILQAKNIPRIEASKLQKPTWHMNKDLL
jgi:hypothetical protein